MANIYLEESTEHLRSLLGEQLPEWIRSHSLIVLRPDVFATRSFDTIVAFLEARRFRIVGAVSMNFNRNMVREQWRESGLHRVPFVFRALVDFYLSTGQSLLLLLEHSADEPRSATELLRALKGPSSPAKRVIGELRGVLGGESALLAFVHTPDNDRAFLLELGVFLSRPQRARLLVPPTTGELSRLRDRLYDEVPRHSLSLAEATRNFQQALAESTRDEAERLAARRRLEGILAGDSADPFSELARLPGAASLSDWDLIVLLCRALRDVPFEGAPNSHD